MPIYEYVCDHCGHHLEALQKISEEPLIYCPECAESSLRKKVSAAAFRLKGTGWYETDFKNNEKDKKKDSHRKKEEGAGVTENSSKETGNASGAGTEVTSDGKQASNKSKDTAVTKSSRADDSGGSSSKPSGETSTGSN